LTTDENVCVLVADDDDEMRRLLHLLLEREDYKVIEAADGEQAIALAFSRRPHVILLDVMLPNGSGFTVCRALRRDTRTRSIPIIFISAMTDAQSQIEGWRLGATEYLTKPVSLNLIARSVRLALQQHEAMRSVDLSPSDT